MAQVPQSILNWLYNVLSNGYHDVNRTYSDVARTLSSNPTLSSRTDVYTYENGRSVLLLNVSGTLPVIFRGATYMFPISIWIPQEYPRAAPITFVTPTKNMVVRAGQHVTAEGRVYHPYLAGWREDRSSLTALLSVLQEVFAREPPVISRQEQVAQPSSTSQPDASRPPPVPPLPPELGRTQSVQSQAASETQPPPPPRPPKASDGQVERRPFQANGAPPVPPHPGRGGLESYTQTAYQQGPRDPGLSLSRHQQYQPQRVNSLRDEHDILPSNQFPQQVPPQFPPQQANTPVSPLSPLPNQTFSRHVPPPLSHRHGPQPQFPSAVQGPTLAVRQNHPQYAQFQFPSSSQLALAPQPPKPKPPQEDLLTSPFENSLPAPAAEIAPPPIPPNPQKDALLQALSQTLTQQVQSTYASNMSAIPPLRAQQAALNKTLNSINHEMSQLNDLQALLDSNEKILRQAMLHADKVLEDAKRRDVPAVEEVLVAPTVVAGQLYEAVIEERVLEECRTVIGKALDKGRIGGDVWAKQTRSLAREEFLKKALIKKISRGMGLVEEERWD